MRSHLFLLILIIAAGCGTTSKTITVQQLSKEQKKSSSRNTPGKCYTKMKYPDGELAWTEVICNDHNNQHYYQRAQAELVRLGFPIDEAEINQKIFGKTTKDALRTFQERNQLAAGQLDEATLWKLINN